MIALGLCSYLQIANTILVSVPAAGIKPITSFTKSVRMVFSWSNPAASFLIFVVSTS